jgi:nucleotide-binding universal stress UspA family protein
MKYYKHILVPLDGSELAELALDYAFSLAQVNQAEVTLLQVILPIEPVAGDVNYPHFVDELEPVQEDMASRYLENVSKRMESRNLKIHVAVKTGHVAETIIDYAHRESIDLIVMATHGRSGLPRWVYGSVADKVLRGTNLPILLIRTHPEREPA